MSEATLVVLENLNGKTAATRADIDAALIAGNATATLRKRLSTLESDLAAAQARHESSHADAHAEAVSAAEDTAVSMARAANAYVNSALASMGADLRLADDDQRFAPAAQGVMHRQLAVHAIQTQYAPPHAKFAPVPD